MTVDPFSALFAELGRLALLNRLEREVRRRGYRFVAGVDEAGRGSLAGPVVAAAVALHPDRHIPGVCDSKTVPAAERERLYDQILCAAIAWAVGEADPSEIDRINIHQASLRAMQRAILALAPLPDIVLVDAFRVPELPMAQRGVPHGDRRCSAIAAASIVAKVTRDRLMHALAKRHPHYHWETNVGYGTPDHQAGLASHGATRHHRRSFGPVSQLSLALSFAPDEEAPALAVALFDVLAESETYPLADHPFQSQELA